MVVIGQRDLTRKKGVVGYQQTIDGHTEPLFIQKIKPLSTESQPSLFDNLASQKMDRDRDKKTE